MSRAGMSSRLLIDTIVSGVWKNTYTTMTGFIQGNLSKIQGLFKDFSRLFYRTVFKD